MYSNCQQLWTMPKLWDSFCQDILTHITIKYSLHTFQHMFCILLWMPCCGIMQCLPLLYVSFVCLFVCILGTIPLYEIICTGTWFPKFPFICFTPNADIINLFGYLPVMFDLVFALVGISPCPRLFFGGGSIFGNIPDTYWCVNW